MRMPTTQVDVDVIMGIQLQGLPQTRKMKNGYKTKRNDFLFENAKHLLGGVSVVDDNECRFDVPTDPALCLGPLLGLALVLCCVNCALQGPLSYFAAAHAYAPCPAAGPAADRDRARAGIFPLWLVGQLAGEPEAPYEQTRQAP